MKKQSFCSMRRAQERTKWPLAVAVIAAAIPMWFAGCSSDTNDPPKKAPVTSHNVTLTAAQRKHIHVYTVTSSKFRKTLETMAVVDFDADQTTRMLAPFSGPVSRLLVSVGDQVKKGQPLAVVDSPDFTAAISAYRKALATARTARRLADLDKDMLAHQGISRREAAQAETAAANAEADRDAALQALVALHVDPKTIEAIQQGRPVADVNGIIRSPIAGTVVAKAISPGQLLQAGSTPCFTVADLSRMWVRARLFGSDIGSVNVGDPVDVVTGVGSKSLPGKVTTISAMVDPATGSVTARVVADNPDGILKQHMYVRVLIHSREQNTGLLAPVSAILRDDENLPFVYVVEPGGSFARRRVTLGYRDGKRFEIRSGLKAGEKIVVEGGIFVRFMQNQ